MKSKIVLLMIFSFLFSGLLSAQYIITKDSVQNIYLIGNLDKTGINDTAALNQYESEYFNAKFLETRKDFDFTNKKVAFFNSSGGGVRKTKVDYFTTEKDRFSRNSSSNSAALVLFNEQQIKENGGYDAVVYYWSKILRDADFYMEKLTVKAKSPQYTKTYALDFYCGLGFPSTSGNLREYFKYNYGGTMYLSYSYKKMTYYLSMSGTNGELKYDIPLNDGNVWQKGNEARFFSYGLSAGYSIYQNLKFEITPFAGLMLSESRPPTSELKEFPYLKQVDVNPIFSPAFGINMTYRFITKNTIGSNGIGNCFGINARAIYVPSAVRGAKIPYKGDICYFSLGVIFAFFAVD